MSNEEGQPTLRSVARAEKEKLTDGVHADPRVQAVMSKFPGAQVVDVRRLAADTGSDSGPIDPVAAPDEDDDL